MANRGVDSSGWYGNKPTDCPISPRLLERIKMAAKTNHAHKYKRHRYKTGAVVYFCALPDCNIKVAPALTVGKKAICWRCEREFTMNEYSIRLAKPHCDECHMPKGGVDMLVTNVDHTEKSIELTPILLEPHKVLTSVDDLRSRLAMATEKDEDI